MSLAGGPKLNKISLAGGRAGVPVRGEGQGWGLGYSLYGEVQGITSVNAAA